VEKFAVGLWRNEPLSGEWFAYHWSRLHGEPVFRKDRWKIEKSTFDDLAVKIKDESTGRVMYSGKLYKEGSHWIKETKAKGHSESTFSRLTSPIPPFDDMFVGICVSIDFDGKILSSVQLISRKDITEAQAKEFLRKTVEVDSSRCSMTVGSLLAGSEALMSHQ
jgi:hypothetical protein